MNNNNIYDPLKTAEALIFIKPHVFRQSPDHGLVIREIREQLANKGISISEEKVVAGPEVKEKNLAEEHYLVIAKSSRYAPDRIPVRKEAVDRFRSDYGVSWDEAVKSGKLVNPFDLKRTAAEIKRIWESVNSAVMMAPGVYVKKVSHEGSDYFLYNGFYPAMKDDFERDDARIHCMTVQFDTGLLSWSSFRDEIIGKTDPAQALESSLRGRFYKNQRLYGLSMSGNANLVHASAGPLEAAREIMIWMDKKAEEVSFFRLLKMKDFSGEKIEWLGSAPIVEYSGVSDTVFEHTEKKNPEEALNILLQIS